MNYTISTTIIFPCPLGTYSCTMPTTIQTEFNQEPANQLQSNSLVGSVEGFFRIVYSQALPVRSLHLTNSDGGYGINTQVEKSKKNDNRKLHGTRFK